MSKRSIEQLTEEMGIVVATGDEIPTEAADEVIYYEQSGEIKQS